jgi:hypothetical protein
MNNETRKKLGWLALALAILGIVEIPARFSAISGAGAGAVLGLGIRLLVIGWLLTLWWKWRKLPKHPK